MKPILFKGPMVQAILEGRKTQTRRVIKPQPKTQGLSGSYADPYNNGPEWAFWLTDNRMTEPRTWRCPYGQPGDRLWVRETWRYVWINAEMDSGDFYTVQFRSGWGVLPFREDWKEFYNPKVVNETWPDKGQIGSWYGKWRPSIHMPRWASRITLEVVSVRIERVSLITSADAEAEGIVKEWDGTAHWYKDYQPGAVGMYKQQPVKSFMTLWDSINTKHTWDTNPWIWVVEFKVVHDEG